jgi:predicted nucleic acid-binding protein
MKVVLNASPIISLSKVTQFTILKRLFTEVLVPQTVSHEILVTGKGRAGAKELSQAIREGWIEARGAKDRLAVKALQRALGHGESEAIVLALEEGADFVILDEIRARREAVRMGMGVMGTLGILKRAKELSLVKEELKTILQKLKLAGFRVSKVVEQDFLKS